MKNMADAGVSSSGDFDWQSQMRFYWEGSDEAGDLFVKQVESKRSFAVVEIDGAFFLLRS